MFKGPGTLPARPRKGAFRRPTRSRWPSGVTIASVTGERIVVCAPESAGRVRPGGSLNVAGVDGHGVGRRLWIRPSSRVLPRVAAGGYPRTACTCIRCRAAAIF